MNIRRIIITVGLVVLLAYGFHWYAWNWQWWTIVIPYLLIDILLEGKKWKWMKEKPKSGG